METIVTFLKRITVVGHFNDVDIISNIFFMLLSIAFAVNQIAMLDTETVRGVAGAGYTLIIVLSGYRLIAVLIELYERRYNADKK